MVFTINHEKTIIETRNVNQTYNKNHITTNTKKFRAAIGRIGNYLIRSFLNITNRTHNSIILLIYLLHFKVHE